MSGPQLPAGLVEIPTDAIVPGDAPALRPMEVDGHLDDVQARLAEQRPLVVTPRESRAGALYTIVVGRSHWEAARVLRLTHVRCRVRALAPPVVRWLRYLEMLTSLPDGYTLRAGWVAQRLLDRTGWSQAALARLLPVTPQAISGWRKAGRTLPKATVRQAADRAGIPFRSLARLPRERGLEPILAYPDPVAGLNAVAVALAEDRPITEVLPPTPASLPPLRLGAGAVRVSPVAVGALPPLQVVRLAARVAWTLLRLRFGAETLHGPSRAFTP